MLTLALLLTSVGVQAAPLSGTVTGRVTDSSGNGIANVVMYALPGVEVNTNNNGYYTFGNLPAGGGYNIVAFAPSSSNYANAHQYNVVVTEGGTTTKNFTLSSSIGTLSGYVYDVSNNARIQGATLVLDSDQHDGWANTAAATGGDGVYNLTHIAAGRSYYLNVFPPAPYNQTYQVVSIAQGSNTFNIGVSIATAGIRGHVGPSGGNAANASIYINTSSGAGGASCSTTTDSSGNYTCPLPTGTYDVHAYNYPGYSGIVQFSVAVNNSYTTVNITLDVGPLNISGYIRDYNLNPINGANTQAFEYRNIGHWNTAFVGGDGFYNFLGMGNDNSLYTMYASAVGYQSVSYGGVPAPANNSWNFNFKLGRFPDVPAYDLNNRIEYPFFYVEFLKARGVVSGYSDGTFRPTTNVRRGEYAKLLVTAAGWPIDTSGGPHFSDVATNYVFYGQIETAYNRGAITGYSDGSFRPNSTVSRAEATKISVAVSGWPLLNPATPSYNDVATNYWAYRYIETARSHGANAGDDAGYFRPNAAGTRAETAKLVCVANTSGCQ